VRARRVKDLHRRLVVVAALGLRQGNPPGSVHPDQRRAAGTLLQLSVFGSPVEALANKARQVAAGGAGAFKHETDDSLKICRGEGPTADPHRFCWERGHEASPLDAPKSSACLSAG